MSEKLGKEIQVGDFLVIGGSACRVASIKPYPKFAELCPGFTARIASLVGPSMGITLADNCLYEIAEAA